MTTGKSIQAMERLRAMGDAQRAGLEKAAERVQKLKPKPLVQVYQEALDGE